MFTQYHHLPRGPVHLRPERRKLLQEVLEKYYIIKPQDATPAIEQSIVTDAYNSVMEELVTAIESGHEWANYVRELAEHFPEYEAKSDLKLQPGMGALLTLHKETHGELTATKTLHLYHSLLGPYFTIFGVDEAYYYNGEIFHLRFDPIITAAPIEEYSSAFTKLLTYHQTRFPDALFMPFTLARYQQPGLRTPWSNHQSDNSWLEALFVNIDFGQYSFRGDLSFGQDKWLNFPLNEVGWTAYPPNTN